VRHMVGLQERALPLPTTLHLLTTIPFHAYPCKGPLPPSPTQRHISPVLDVRPAVCSCYSSAFAAVIRFGWSNASRASSLLVHHSPPLPIFTCLPLIWT
jgi:hypothetical protein